MKTEKLPEEKRNRIFFPGNPWPKGHRITDLYWDARYDPKSGFWFNLSLASDVYHAEDPNWREESDDNKALSNWTAKAAWMNFHYCNIDGWGFDMSGFLAFSKEQKFDLAALENKTFCVDPLPRDLLQENSFHTYLIGHDSIAAHRIHFGPLQQDGGFLLDWSGKIALSYYENDEYKYDFQAHYDSVKLRKVYLPTSIEIDAKNILQTKFQNPEQFQLVVAETSYSGRVLHYAAVVKPPDVSA